MSQYYTVVIVNLIMIEVIKICKIAYHNSTDHTLVGILYEVVPRMTLGLYRDLKENNANGMSYSKYKGETRRSNGP